MKLKNVDLKILFWPVVVVLFGILLYFLTPRLVELFGLLTGLLLPFIIGYVLSKAVNPLADLLQRKLKILRGVTAILVIIVVICGLVLLVYRGASTLSFRIKDSLVNNPDFKDYFMAQYSLAINKLMTLYNSMPDVIQDALSGVVSGSGSATGVVMDYATRFVKAMPNAFVGTIVCVLSFYFMVSDSATVTKLTNRVFKIQFEKSALVWAQIKKYLGGYVKAQLIIMSITAVVMSIWFIILGARYAIPIALGIALLDALPIFGSGLILWPWSIMSFLNGDIRMGICLILVYASVALTRHLTEPKLVSTSVGMNPLLTLMSMYIGYRTLSVGGLIAGPLIMLFIVSLYKGKVFDTPILIIKQVFKKTGQTLNAIKEYILSDD